jgi:hypothetical protein
MVNNSTNINKTNFHLSPSSLNSDGQQFHQYQQNELSPLTFKFKQWWSTIPPISTKQTVSYNFKSLNIKKTTAYDVGNPCLGLRQAQKCGRDKLVNGIPSLCTCLEDEVLNMNCKTILKFLVSIISYCNLYSLLKMIWAHKTSCL